jgi:hypothetical protein
MSIIIFLIVKILNLIKEVGMSPITFLFVVVIMLTFNATMNLISGFRETTSSTEIRVFDFAICTGLAIWGWLIYLT